MLAVGDARKAFSDRTAQKQLKDILCTVQELVGAERVTAWLIDSVKMWCVCNGQGVVCATRARVWRVTAKARSADTRLHVTDATGIQSRP